ncbi:MAG: tetratricopeptide repeat protein [Novosphingobium sp.]|nr:tetratricopeptide repeat protein [Novosphingobium sp.]
MIVTGSAALVLNGIQPSRPVRDLDLLGTEEDIEIIRQALGDRIVREIPVHGHRRQFQIRDADPYEKIELDFAQTPAEQAFAALCDKRAEILGLDVLVPPVEALYLLKRGHANRPVHFRKTISDLMHLKPLIGQFTPEQEAFLPLYKQEVQERYNRHRERFSLALMAEELRVDKDLMVYQPADIRNCIAFWPGAPVIGRCIGADGQFSPELFHAMSIDDQLQMMREEFITIGIDRFYSRDPSLSAAQIYDLGLRKTVQDLFGTVLQDFCIDRIETLVTPPDDDFLARFEEARRDGRVQAFKPDAGPPKDIHKRAWALVQQGKLGDARRVAEDLVRRAPHTFEPHAFFVLGAALAEAGRTYTAHLCLRKSLSQQPQNAIALYYLGLTLGILKKPEDARHCFDAAERGGHSSAALYFNRGLALEKLGDAEGAANDLRKAAELMPDNPAITRKLAQLAG